MKEIPLTRGMVALVDDEDYEMLAQYRWCVKACGSRLFYAVRALAGNGGKQHVVMHRVLLNPLPGFDVDHVDGNGLNNQRSNMRVATRQQNIANKRISSRNTSGFKGVSLHRASGKWQVFLRIPNGKNKNLGNYETREEAARVYDDAARKWNGQFARLNFPRKGEMSAR